MTCSGSQLPGHQLTQAFLVESATWQELRREQETSHSGAPVAHACNPSYSGDRNQEDQGSLVLETLSWKYPTQKKGWWSGSRGRSWIHDPVLQKKKHPATKVSFSERDLSLLPRLLWTPGLQQSSCLSLLSDWNHRYLTWLLTWVSHLFVFFSTGVWTQGIHLEPLYHQPFFGDGLFWDRVSWTICLGWLWTKILLISASWVARVTGL
jgi:hypothetical protein